MCIVSGDPLGDADFMLRAAGLPYLCSEASGQANYTYDCSDTEQTADNLVVSQTVTLGSTILSLFCILMKKLCRCSKLIVGGLSMQSAMLTKGSIVVNAVDCCLRTHPILTIITGQQFLAITQSGTLRECRKHDTHS